MLVEELVFRPHIHNHGLHAQHSTTQHSTSESGAPYSVGAALRYIMNSTHMWPGARTYWLSISIQMSRGSLGKAVVTQQARFTEVYAPAVAAAVSASLPAAAVGGPWEASLLVVAPCLHCCLLLHPPVAAAALLAGGH